MIQIHGSIIVISSFFKNCVMTVYMGIEVTIQLRHVGTLLCIINGGLPSTCKTFTPATTTADNGDDDDDDGDNF